MLLQRLLKEELRGAKTEAVEDNLHRFHVGVFDGLEGFFHLLDTDPVVADFAGFDKTIQDAEDFGAIVDGGGRAVKLHQVETLDCEIAEAVFDETGEVGFVIAIRGVGGEPATGFGGDDDFFAAVAFELRDEAFAVAHAVDVGGVDEVDAAVDGLIQGGERFTVIDGAPGAADGPGAETDFRDVVTGSSKRTIFHVGEEEESRL